MNTGKPTQYGLIGLGNVGTDLVRAAIADGLDVHVFDIDPPAVERAVGAGAVPESSGVAVARGAGVLVLSLPNATIVDDVLLTRGALAAMRPGTLLIDMSTNLPERSVGLVAEGNRCGVHVLDAPVSYGPDGLVSFVGGTDADVDAAREWLDAVVTSYTHVGPAGHGQYVKLVQNLLTGVGTAVIAEAIGFASHAGVDQSVLLEALRHTGAQSPLLAQTYPAMIERRYGSTGAMALHAKDMGYALQTAAGLGAKMPFARTLKQVFDETLAAGDPRWTQNAVIEWFAPAVRETQQG